MRTAGVVLAGGRSSRMGAPKAALEWHGSTLLHRTAALVARAVDGPVVVVRAAGQELPDLPRGAEVLEDLREGRGPLQGMAVGLAALQDRADAAFVCSTDLPFLHPELVHRLLRALDDDVDVVLPVARGFPQPLAAVYRTSLAERVAKLVEAERLRPAFLFDECPTRRLGDDALLADARLASLDPDLESFANINEPSDYAAARARPAPDVTVERFGVLASGGHRGTRKVSAATVGAAADAVGLPLPGAGRHVLAAVNGDQTTRDDETPLVRGDIVAFLSADAGG